MVLEYAPANRRPVTYPRGKDCPECSTRMKEDARYCHECDYTYDPDVPWRQRTFAIRLSAMHSIAMAAFRQVASENVHPEKRVEGIVVYPVPGGLK